MNDMIKEISTLEELKSSTNVIRKSFYTVADEFGLTVQNCPTNPAFLDESDLLNKKEKNNVSMYGLFDECNQIGFVALEKPSPDSTVFYLERLAVLPEHRHKGYGRLLMDYAFEAVRKNNGQKISIGIINENIRLKNWYVDYGFKELEIKQYPHLPFDVCFLEKDV